MQIYFRSKYKFFICGSQVCGPQTSEPACADFVSNGWCLEDLEEIYPKIVLLNKLF